MSVWASKLCFYNDGNPCHQKNTTKQNISLAREKNNNINIKMLALRNKNLSTPY